MEDLDPDISHAKFPTLVPLASRFYNLITASKLQTRRLRLVTLPPFEQMEMAPEEFWKLSAIKDVGGNPPNVDVERIFFVCKPSQNEDAR